MKAETHHDRILGLTHAVADYFDVPVAAILGPQRDRAACFARAAAAWLAHGCLFVSYTDIGEVLGRDKWTISQAVRKFAGTAADSPQLKNELQMLPYLPVRTPAPETPHPCRREIEAVCRAYDAYQIVRGAAGEAPARRSLDAAIFSLRSACSEKGLFQ